MSAKRFKRCFNWIPYFVTGSSNSRKCESSDASFNLLRFLRNFHSVTLFSFHILDILLNVSIYHQRFPRPVFNDDFHRKLIRDRIIEASIFATVYIGLMRPMAQQGRMTWWWYNTVTWTTLRFNYLPSPAQELKITASFRSNVFLKQNFLWAGKTLHRKQNTIQYFNIRLWQGELLEKKKPLTGWLES